MEEARHLIDHNQKAYVAKDYPNAEGNTIKPKEVFKWLFFIFFVLLGQGGCQLQYLILWSSKKKMDQLYAEGWVSKKSYFDEEIEWRFYELWHHEGRRAPMRVAMMAPDYAWWHGFYELKRRYVHFMELSGELAKEGETRLYEDFPGRFDPPTLNSVQ